MFLMPGLDPAAANAPGLRVRERGRAIRRRSGRRLVVEIMEARLGAEFGMHLETLMRTQQLGDVAVRIFDIAEMQCVRDAGIDASRRRARIAARRQAVLDAEIDAIGAERAFLRDPEARGILAFDLVLHRVVTIGEVLLGDLEAGLIGTGDVAIGAADADVVVDGDNAVGALARRGRRTNMHAGRVGAVLAADRHKGALDIRERAGFDIEHRAPLHRRRGGVGMPAGRGAGLAADATLEIGDHRPAGHGAPARRVTLTLTKSALDPVASVRSSSIGTKAFMLGALKSLAYGVTQ